LNVYERAAAKTLDFKWLSTVRLGIQVGGYLSPCPEHLELLLFPSLTNIGTGGKSRDYYYDGTDWNSGKSTDNVPFVIGTPSYKPTPHVARSLGLYDADYYRSEDYSYDNYDGRDNMGCPNLGKVFTPNLLYVGGDLVVRNNPKLAALSFPKLIGVGMLNDPKDYGDIIVEGNDKLEMYFAPTATLTTTKKSSKHGDDKHYVGYDNDKNDKPYYPANDYDGGYLGKPGRRNRAPTYRIRNNRDLKLVVMMSSPDCVCHVDPCQNTKSLVSIYALPHKIKEGADALYYKIEDAEMKYMDTLDALEDNKHKGLEFLSDVLDDKIDFLKFGDNDSGDYTGKGQDHWSGNKKPYDIPWYKGGKEPAVTETPRPTTTRPAVTTTTPTATSTTTTGPTTPTTTVTTATSTPVAIGESL
jgi:hypothetical protein